MKIRIVAVDDHPVLLTGVEEIIAPLEELELVAGVKDSTELLDVLSAQRVDVVVADFSIPGGRYGDGVSLLRFLQRRFPDVRLVVLTGIESAMVLRSILGAGVNCIVGKIDPDQHLVPAIHAAMRDERYLAPSIEALIDQAEVAEAAGGAIASLSRRESEVLRMFAEGLGVQQIAERVGRSPKTISTQKVSAMRKLGLARDTDVFAFALANGLVSASQAARGAPGDTESLHAGANQDASDGSPGGNH